MFWKKKIIPPPPTYPILGNSLAINTTDQAMCSALIRSRVNTELKLKYCKDLDEWKRKYG